MLWQKSMFDLLMSEASIKHKLKERHELATLKKSFATMHISNSGDSAKFELVL